MANVCLQEKQKRPCKYLQGRFSYPQQDFLLYFARPQTPSPMLSNADLTYQHLLENSKNVSTFVSTIKIAMKVSFVLINRNRKLSAVQARLRFKGRIFSYNTGVSVEVASFVDGKSNDKFQNIQLREVEAAIQQAVLHFERKALMPSIEEFRTVVDQFNNGFTSQDIDQRKQDVITFIREIFVADYAFSERTKMRFIYLSNFLQEYSQRRYLFFNEVTKVFETRLRRWMTEQNYSKNYIGTVIKMIKTVMNSAHQVYRLHDNLDYKLFKVDSETADSVYLTMEELERIHKLDLHTPEVKAKLKEWNYTTGLNALTIAKNKFLIGAICALRISDFSRLNTDNFEGGRVFIMPKKGNSLRKPEPIILPMHPIIRQIIDSGFDLNSTISEQHINKGIKILCRLAGINDPVTKYITRGGELCEEKYEKWELVTSHTARRSGATNMDLSGMDRRIIQVCTGHSSQAMLEKYLKASIREVTAEKLQQSRYFKNESLRRSQLRKQMHDKVNELIDSNASDEDVEKFLKDWESIK